MALAVAAKDLRSEWRGRELLPALAQFIILAVVIANFAFDLDLTSGPRLSPGILWLVLVFAGLVAFGRAFAGEKETGSLDAMLLTPAGATAIFAGKALAAAVLLAGLFEGRTVVMATHDAALARELCDRAMLLKAGRDSGNPWTLRVVGGD